MVATRPVLAGRCGGANPWPWQRPRDDPLGHVMFHDKRAPGLRRRQARSIMRSGINVPSIEPPYKANSGSQSRTSGCSGISVCGNVGDCDDDIDGAVHRTNVAKDVASAISRW